MEHSVGRQHEQRFCLCLGFQLERDELEHSLGFRHGRCFFRGGSVQPEHRLMERRSRGQHAFRFQLRICVQPEPRR